MSDRGAAACLTKIRYASKLAAEEALKDFLDRGGRSKKSYYCIFCGGWHLSSHLVSRSREIHDKARDRKIRRVVAALRKKVNRVP